MFGVALIFYILFLFGYGAFLWVALWHVRAYRLSFLPEQGGQKSPMERVCTALVVCISILLLASLLLFFKVPWQFYSLFPSSLP